MKKLLKLISIAPIFSTTFLLTLVAILLLLTFSDVAGYESLITLMALSVLGFVLCITISLCFALASKSYLNHSSVIKFGDWLKNSRKDETGYSFMKLCPAPDAVFSASFISTFFVLRGPIWAGFILSLLTVATTAFLSWRLASKIQHSKEARG